MFKDIRTRLYDIAAVIEETEVEAARKHRLKLLDRAQRLIRQENGDPKRIYARAIATDWPVYAALDLTTREGLPFIYSAWQEEFDSRVNEYDDFLLMNARQIGKSTGSGGEILKRMMRGRNRRALLIAPTEKQLEVRDMVRHFIDNSEFIQEQYVRAKDGGKLGVEEILFAENGCHFEAINLSITSSAGDTKRGKTATDIFIDEIQMVGEETQTAAIDPMLSNALPGIRRRLVRFGTFSFKYRGDFDRVVQQALDSSEVGYMNVTCWDAMDDNIRSPTGAHGMKSRFEKLNIPCSYVRTTGVCPRALPHWFDDLAGVKPAEHLKVIQPGEFKCNLVCYQNDVYVAEDLAQAPMLGDRFFPKDWLVRIARSYRFWTMADFMTERVPVIASVDVGKLQDPTEIVIDQILFEEDAWGTKTQKLKTIGNITVEPYSVNRPGEKEKPSYQRIVDAIKAVDKMAKPVCWMIDITRNEELVNQLLSGDDGLDPAAIYTNEAAEKNELRGIWWTGPDKARMFENHQRVIAEGRRIIPARTHEPVFFDKYFEDHTAVRRKERSVASYTVFEDTGHLVDSMAMGSLWLLDPGQGPATFEFNFVKRW